MLNLKIVWEILCRDFSLKLHSYLLNLCCFKVIVLLVNHWLIL